MIKSTYMTTNLSIIITVILLIILSPSSAHLQNCPTNEFEEYSTELDATKVSSVQKLTDKLKKQSDSKSEKCVSELMNVYYRFYQKAMVSFDEAENIMATYPSKKAEEEIERKISIVGWKLLFTEGIYYIGEDGAWITKEFSEILPDSWKDYFDYRSKEIEEGFSEDAILLITWNQLYERIKHGESFLNKHPTFPLNDDVEGYLSIYVRTYLTGMDNSRITTGYEGKKLRNDVRESYELFIKENKNSKYFNIVKGYYEIIKMNEFIVNEEADKFLIDNNIKSMFAVQPPTY